MGEAVIGQEEIFWESCPDFKIPMETEDQEQEHSLLLQPIEQEQRLTEQQQPNWHEQDWWCRRMSCYWMMVAGLVIVVFYGISLLKCD